MGVVGKEEEEGGFNSVFDSIPKSFKLSKLLNFFLLDLSNLTGLKHREHRKYRITKKYHQHLSLLLSRCLQHNILCCFSRSLGWCISCNTTAGSSSWASLTSRRDGCFQEPWECAQSLSGEQFLPYLRCRAVCGPASVQVHGHSGAQDLRVVKSSWRSICDSSYFWQYEDIKMVSSHLLLYYFMGPEPVRRNNNKQSTEASRQIRYLMKDSP